MFFHITFLQTFSWVLCFASTKVLSVLFSPLDMFSVVRKWLRFFTFLLRCAKNVISKKRKGFVISDALPPLIDCAKTKWIIQWSHHLQTVMFLPDPLCLYKVPNLPHFRRGASLHEFWKCSNILFLLNFSALECWKTIWQTPSEQLITILKQFYILPWIISQKA